MRPNYVYVASSWRNMRQPSICATLRTAGIHHYDFRNPEGGTGFSWREVRPAPEIVDTILGPVDNAARIPAKGTDLVPAAEYLSMVDHPRAIDGFEEDFAAMQRADAFLLVLPCGRSAHLELGWAVGAGKRTAILLDDPVEPELMYRMVDLVTPDLADVFRWMGVR